jgi:hypothetical protein
MLPCLAVAASSAAAAFPRVPAFADQRRTANCGVTDLVTANKSEALLCESTGGSFVLQASGPAARLVWHKPFDPLGGQPPTVLARGATWTWNAITCKLTASTITCTNRQHHGFTVGSRAAKTF